MTEILNESVNQCSDEAVCWTGPSTMGLSNIIKMHMLINKYCIGICFHVLIYFQIGGEKTVNFA